MDLGGVLSLQAVETSGRISRSSEFSELTQEYCRLPSYSVNSDSDECPEDNQSDHNRQHKALGDGFHTMN